MSRDRRSAPQQPSFVWESLDSPAHEPSAALASGREDAPAPVSAEPVGESGVDEEARGAEREPGARRVPGRALIAAAVLVPLAGASCAVLAYSTRHDGTTAVTAGASQVPGLVSAGSSSHGGPTIGAGTTGTGPGTSVSRAAGGSPGLRSSLPPSADDSTTATAGSTHAPSPAATTAVATPQHTTVDSAPTKSKPATPAKTNPTQTKASRPGCSAAWNPDTSYTPGQVVSYQGQNYTATYYSTDAVPDAATSWDVWTSDGTCS